MKRAGKFSTCLGREAERDSALGMRRIKGVPPDGGEQKGRCVSPSGRAGKRLGVVRKWEVSLMFIFA